MPSVLFFDKVPVYLQSVHDVFIRCTSNFRRLPVFVYPKGRSAVSKAHMEGSASGFFGFCRIFRAESVFFVRRGRA